MATCIIICDSSYLEATIRYGEPFRAKYNHSLHGRFLFSQEQCFRCLDRVRFRCGGVPASESKAAGGADSPGADSRTDGGGKGKRIRDRKTEVSLFVIPRVTRDNWIPRILIGTIKSQQRDTDAGAAGTAASAPA